MLNIIKKIYHAADDTLGKAFRSVYSRHAKVDPKKIVFMTHSDAYECNPKYIADEMLRQGLDLKLVFVAPKRGEFDRTAFPKEIKLVRRDSFAALREISSARFWIDNSINFLWQEGIEKKKNQVYFEVWHGSLGIKRIGREDVKNERWVRLAGACNDVTDYCVSNSSFESEVYRTSFWQKPKILLYGHPRNDCLFDAEKIKRAGEKIRKKYGLAPDCKLLLFAPTFRENRFDVLKDFDFEKLRDSLSRRFGGEWSILLRHHFEDRNKKGTEKGLPSFVKDVTDHLDIQELLCAADAGLTDYSSWAYDYILTGKPLFIYAPDKEEYCAVRGLYYPLESTPFPVAETGDRLAENIAGFDAEKYAGKVREFLEEKGCVEDGNASKRVVKKIKELCIAGK